MLGGLKVKLDDITNYIQSICENICTVLDVDVTVVSKDLIRIAEQASLRIKYMKNFRPFSFFKSIKVTEALYY